MIKKINSRHITVLQYNTLEDSWVGWLILILEGRGVEDEGRNRKKEWDVGSK